MNLDSAYNLQSDIFKKVFGFQEVAVVRSADAPAGPTFLARQGSSAYQSIVAGRKKKKRDARDLIALGTLVPEGGNKDPEDFRIAIFVQRQDLRQHPLVEQIQQMAFGETRTIYTGKVIRRAKNPFRRRPLLIGASVGHHRVSAGSIGCLCRHREGGGIGLISNNHILADTNRGEPGDIIIQPGRADGGHRVNDKVATLFDFVPIDFEPESRNFVDCAFATLLAGIEYDGATIYDPNTEDSWPVSASAEELIARDPVFKIGRTTGLTRGVVTAIDVNNLVVAMVLGHGERLARFDNQISVECATEAFSEGGDSGSVIFSEGGAPAALLFAGSEKGGLGGKGVTFANPIQTVFDKLNVDLHTGS